jgi:dipeptidyl aminopeptidase/acylaminoacyl peptidase
MSVDERGRTAADSLWATTGDLDVEARLGQLHRAGQPEASRRRAVVGAAALVAALAVGAAAVRPVLDTDTAPPPATTSGLGPGYDVLATAVSPSGQLEAVATLRDGQPAVVLVRRAGSGNLRVVWSAETPQELVRTNPSRPVAVAWSPDGRRLAVLVARPPYGESATTDELRLITLDRDGSDRREVPAELGPCTCSAHAPTLSWADAEHLEVGVPRVAGSDKLRVPLS